MGLDMRELKGHVFKNASKRNSYEVLELQATAIWTIATWIQDEFGFQPKTLPIFGLDEVFLDLWKDQMQITVGWDNWSGIFVMAHTEQGDPAIEEIGRYIESRLTELDEHRWHASAN